MIILDDHLEAYERSNPYNFRNNLHCGGKSAPYSLPDQQIQFCRKVMQRGAFPYAHLDLMLTQDGDHHLMEINLRGGLKGARISGKEYQEKKSDAPSKKLLEELHASSRRVSFEQVTLKTKKRRIPFRHSPFANSTTQV